jgi:hypothetical protein
MRKRKCKFTDELKVSIRVSEIVATSVKLNAWYVNQQRTCLWRTGCSWFPAHVKSSFSTKIWKPPLQLICHLFYGRQVGNVLFSCDGYMITLVPAISREHTAFIFKGLDVRKEMCDLLNGVWTVPIKIVAKLVGCLHGVPTFFSRTFPLHYVLPKGNSCFHAGISFMYVSFSLMQKQRRTDSPWHLAAARATSPGANKKDLCEHDKFWPQ